MTINPATILCDLVPEDLLSQVFGGTNFGSRKPRDIVRETVLKIAGGYHAGYTATQCCKELGLIKKLKDPRKMELTKNGQTYLFWAFDDALTSADYEEVIADHRRLVRELDVALNGEDGAAQQASLCDIVAMVKDKRLKVTPAIDGADIARVRELLVKAEASLRIGAATESDPWKAINQAIILLDQQKPATPERCRACNEPLKSTAESNVEKGVHLGCEGVL